MIVEMLFRRNQNFRDIVRSMRSLGSKSLSVVDLTNKLHHFFFFGDLNYRVDNLEPLVSSSVFRLFTDLPSGFYCSFIVLSLQQIIDMIKDRKFNTLLRNDQLKKCQADQKAFIEFSAFDSACIIHVLVCEIHFLFLNCGF